MAHLRLFQLLIRAAWLSQTPRAVVAQVIHRVLIGLAGGMILLGGPVLAEDPPTRVGSLNYISGEVSYALRGEEGEPGSPDALSWTPADFNQPICQDMSLKTGAMARARVRIGPDAIQLSGGTSLNMLNLNDQLIEASVPYGRIHLRLSELDHGEVVELEMARGSLWLLQPGDYDLDTGAADQPTRIIVFSGKARFIGGESDLPIAAGHEVQVSGNYPAVVATERHSDELTFKLPEPSQAATPAAQPAAQPTVPPPAAVEPKAAPASQSPPAVPEPPKSAEEAPSAPPPSAPAATPAGSQGERREARVATAENPRGSSDDFLFWVEDPDNNPPPAQQSAQYVSAGGDRVRGARPIRPMADLARCRAGLVPELGARRLGALPVRALGVDPALGLDLDRRPALGFCAVSLRPLDQCRRPLGMGSGDARPASGLRPGAGSVSRRAGRFRWRPGRRPRCRLVSARARRRLCAVVRGGTGLCRAGQRFLARSLS